MSDATPTRAVRPDEYGDGYRADFLTMYHEYVASADKISERRTAANTFFVSANAGILGLNGYFLQNGDETSLLINDALWVPALAAILMCWIWRGLISSYKSLNGAKFGVILEMERQLPAAPYTDEWARLQDSQRSQKHIPLSDSEKYVPMVFMIVNVGIFTLSFTNFILGKLG